MLDRLQKIFNDLTGRDDIVITPKTKLNNKEYNFSSFALIQLVCAIEDEFDIEIPNSEIKKFKTVKNVLDYIEKNT
jgi:acyl carrier protein